MAQSVNNKACKALTNTLNSYETHRSLKDSDSKVQAAVSFLNQASASKSISKKVVNNLQFKVAALKYRSGKELPQERANSKILSKLIEKAKEWKKDQIVYENEEELTEEQLNVLEEFARFPDSARAILKNSFMLENFFKWALLSKLSVRIFVEFPFITEKLCRSKMRMQLGAFNGEHLNLRERNGKKDVTITMEGKQVSILKRHRVVSFSYGVKLTVDRIFEIFKLKNKDESFLSFFEDEGICNWDAHQLSPVDAMENAVNPIDLEKPDWYLSLPMREYLTNEEATEKFGFNCDGSQYVFTVVGARQTNKLNTFGSHSFFRLGIPDGNGGYHYTHGWGKFTKRYPQNPLHLASFLCGPKLATLEYPDNNEKYERQKIERHFPMTMEKGLACVDSLRRNLVNSRNNNLGFQILVHNCTDWVAKNLRKYVSEEAGRMFEMDFLELEPSGLMGGIVKIMRKMPKWFNDIFFFCLALVLGGKKKLKLKRKDGSRKVVSVLKTPPWKRKFQHPGVMFRRQIEVPPLISSQA